MDGEWLEQRMLRNYWQWQRQTGRARAHRRRRRRDPRRVLAIEAERLVGERLALRGFQVRETGHKEHYDLLAYRPGEPGAIRVEVKAARWSSGRYGARMRSNEADVLVFVCRNGTDHCFVIPFDRVGVDFIKVTSYEPADYVGQWMPYYEAWNVLDDFSKNYNPWQLELPGMDNSQ